MFQVWRESIVIMMSPKHICSTCLPSNKLKTKVPKHKKELMVHSIRLGSGTAEPGITFYLNWPRWQIGRARWTPPFLLWALLAKSTDDNTLMTVWVWKQDLNKCFLFQYLMIRRFYSNTILSLFFIFCFQTETEDRLLVRAQAPLSHCSKH